MSPFVPPLSSSEALIRALKSPHDPPFPDGPSKIELATTAWLTQSLYVPAKAQVLVEWALTKMLRDRTADGVDTSITDVRWWHLLSLVLVTQSAATQQRSLTAWLPSLVSRVPSLPVLSTFFRLLSSSTPVPLDLATEVLSTYEVLMPHAVTKASLDAVSECFGAVLHAFAALQCAHDSDAVKTDDCFQEPLVKLALLVVSAFRSSIVNASNKKKVLSSFIDNHLTDWLTTLQNLVRGTLLSTQLRAAVYQAGEDILFGVDALRQYLEPFKAGFLLDHLVAHASPAAVLNVLPDLMSSYICALRRNPTILPSSSSQTSSNSALRLSALQLFRPCLAMVDGSKDPAQCWMTRLSLLKLIDRERCYDTAVTEWKSTLSGCVEMAIARVSIRGIDESIVSAIDILSLISQMEFGLLEPHVEHVISCCIDMTETANLAFQTLLRHILDYHSKTRTVHSFLKVVTSAINGLDPQGSAIPQFYSKYAGGPLYSSSSQDRLEGTIVSFLTPGQSLDALRHVNASLKALADASEVAPGASNRPSKRRKTPRGLLHITTEQEHAAMRFALLGRTAASVYSALLRWDTSEQMLIDARHCADELAAEVLDPILTCLVSTESLGSLGWTQAIRITTALRLAQILAAADSLEPVLVDRNVTEICISMNGLPPLIRAPSTLPELRIEAISFVFHKLSFWQGLSKRFGLPVSDALDAILESAEGAGEPKLWSGVTAASSERSAGFLPALHRLLTDQGFQVVNRLGTQEQIRRAAHILLTVFQSTTVQPSHSHLLHGVIGDPRQSSHFWELSGLQDHLVNAVNEITAYLDSTDISSLLEGASSSHVVYELTSGKTIGIFQALLSFPLEFLSRQMAVVLVKRALAADIALHHIHGRKDSSALSSHTILRTFLLRAMKHIPGVSLPLAAAIKHIVCSAHLSEDFINLSIAFVEVLHLEAMSNLKQDPAVMIQILTTYYNMDLRKDRMPEDAKSSGSKPLQWKAVISLLNQFALHFSKGKDAPQEVMRLLQELVNGLCASAWGQDVHALRLDRQLDLHALALVVNSWTALLALRNWIPAPLDYSGLARRAPMIVAFILSSNQRPHDSVSQSLCTSLFSIVADEWLSTSSQKSVLRDQMLALYLLLRENDFSREQLHPLVRAVRGLDSDDWQSLMSVARGELIASAAEAPFSSRNTGLVEVVSYLLTDGPSGESMRAAISSTLQVLSDLLQKACPTELCDSVVTLLLNLCSDRAAMISADDVSHIWSILCVTLAGSTAHSACPFIFSSLTSVVTTLVRLRRDLVIGSLPQLSAVISRLFLALRAVRPMLGEKQASIVSDSLPVWLSPAEPLGESEAARLSRLLGNLVVKTSTRSRDHVSKAESLAKPYSRHASYVLRTYLYILADHFSFLRADIRRELEPGLFALCSMIGEHGRDALMASIANATVKSLFKLLWKDYEKQRYIGQG